MVAVTSSLCPAAAVASNVRSQVPESKWLQWTAQQQIEMKQIGISNHYARRSARSVRAAQAFKDLIESTLR